ncbi:hypothetical protein D9M69_534620 [compost metagenome]
MAHAGAEARVEAAVHVSERFGRGGHEVGAAGEQGGERGRERVAGAGEDGFEPFVLLAGQHRLRRGQHVVDELVGQDHAGDQGVGHAELAGGLGDVARAGRALAAPVGQQPAPQGAVVSNQHRGLGQHEVAESVQIGLDQVLVPPRQVGHVGHHGHVRVVGGGLGDGAQRLGGAGKADLDQLDLDVFEDGARLLGHGLFLEGEVVEDLGRVARVGARHHRQNVSAHRSHGQRVGAQAARAARIAGIEHQHAGGIQVAFAQRLVVLRGVVKIARVTGVLVWM